MRRSIAVWWSAHGLKYGLPVSIEADIRAGRTVVCNVSRTIVADARAHYANVIVVLVTAPPEVLAARLAARARGSDGSVRDRVGRSPALDNNLKPDVLIENVGTIEPSVQTLVRVISGFEPV
jgi:ribose 1,5-bisphosphokinase